MKAEQTATTIEVKGIVARLDKLNCTVARHEREFGELRVHVAQRDSQCPVVETVESRVRTLEDANTARSAAEDRSPVNATARPFIWAAGILGLMILQNAPSILRAVIHWNILNNLLPGSDAAG